MTTRTLLLTPWYIPIQVLHWQDAIKMVYEETVDVVVEYDEDVRSPSVTWKMPAVVRLRKLKRDRTRAEVLAATRPKDRRRDGTRRVAGLPRRVGAVNACGAFWRRGLRARQAFAGFQTVTPQSPKRKGTGKRS